MILQRMGPVLALVMILSARPSLAGGQQSAHPVDSRLQTQVTIHESRIELSALLRKLSTQTRVEMRADKEVAILHASVFVRNLPLKTFQARLAETLHLTWRAEEADPKQPVTYRLYRSMRDKAAEQSVRDAEGSALRDGLEDAVKALALSGDDLDKAVAGSPGLAMLVRSPRDRLIPELFNRLDSVQQDSLLNGRPVNFSYGDLPDPLQKMAAGAYGVGGARTSPPETVRFIRGGFGPNSTVGISLTGSQGGTLFKVVPGFSAHAYRDIFPLQRDEKEYAPARRPTQVPNSLAGRTFDELLEKVSDTLGINAIAESYQAYRAYPGSVPAGTTTVEEVLDRGVLGDSIWWKRGNVYMFQRKYWFDSRLYEAPDAIAQEIKEVWKTTPHSLEDWGRLGTLSKEQWIGLQSIKLSDFDVLVDLQPLMAFYGPLPRMHRTSLFTTSGLNAARLSPRDLDRLKAWLVAQGMFESGLNDIADVQSQELQTLTVRATPKQRSTLFEAVASYRDGSTHVLRRQSVPALPKLAIRPDTGNAKPRSAQGPP